MKQLKGHGSMAVEENVSVKNMYPWISILIVFCIFISELS